ncbi:hypothetical protein JMJ35_005740 [Cladonia borealis]|uniref:Trichothecene 3-O-acetyltransferase n=1 Tax=Cladonia borealis TaxID=184061 RepID=A0AA39V867_9LECA|nr:hypothetical protein JMJ35_005740 [Cladonia borealis]
MADQAAPVLPIFRLSPLDMLVPRMHVPKLLYFSSTSASTQILANLRKALALTIEAMPILGGSITLSESEKDQKGSLNVQSPYFTAEDIVSSNDLSNQYDYQKLCSKHFPSDGVPLEECAPKLFGTSADSMPVMMAQVNFLNGGLLLFFAVHHCVMDEVGMFNVLKVWSTCARGDSGLDFVSSQWFDREPLMQGAGTGKLEDHPEYTLSPEGIPTNATESPEVFYPKSTDVDSAVFFLSDENLERLKSSAIRTESANVGQDMQGKPWISTNDALIALFWCSITSARLNEGLADAANIFPRFGMAMNGRGHLKPPMSPDFSGNMVLIAKTFTSAGTLLPSNPERLADAALLVRKSINVVDDAYIRDTIQLVRSVKDLGQLASRRRPAVEHSLGCSTWASQPYYSLDWGNLMGGKCERVRWRNLRTDGLFVIFPRLPRAGVSENNSDSRISSGGVEVLLGLKTAHMQRLKQDELFNQFAQWRCN